MEKKPSGISRRHFLGTGLAATAALMLPNTALAQTLSQTGVAEDGTLIEGFVKVSGNTYGYVGGEKQLGAAKVCGQWYHFDESGGEMTFGKVAYGDGFWLSKENGVLEEAGELETGDYDDGVITGYRIDEDSHLAALIVETPTGVNIYRLYNPNSSFHFFTTSLYEAKTDAQAGWRWEGVAWVASEDGSPVYRLYDMTSGDHMYTASQDEKKSLVEAGWKDEGVAFWFPSNGSSVYRLYNKNQGDHFFTASANERDALVKAGWTSEGVGFGCTGNAAVAIEPFWLVTDAWGTLERYWVASDASLAKSRLITAAEGAGYDAYATETGAVVRNRQRIGSVVLIADNDGKLLLPSYSPGWLVTDDLDGELQRYYIDASILSGVNAARVGEFAVDGKNYVGRYDTGYVVRGTYCQDGFVYKCDNDGVLISKTEENWWEDKGYTSDIISGVGYAKLCVRVATRVIPPDSWLTVGGAWDRTGDSRAQEYLKVCDASSVRYGADNTGYNPAFASCTQAAAMVARACIDPDMDMSTTEDNYAYLCASDKFNEVAWCGSVDEFDSKCEPGDILVSSGMEHTSVYVGNELVRMKYPDSAANVWEAHYAGSCYPGLIRGGRASYSGYHVFRFNGTTGGCKHSYINPWKLLAGDADWDNYL